MGLLMKMFGTGADLPFTGTQEEIKKKFNGLRWRVFASITIGYAFYYIIRQSYSVIKKPLLASGIVDPAQVGFIGSVFFVTYGLGKFTNSFLSDRMEQQTLLCFWFVHVLSYHDLHGLGKFLRTIGCTLGY